MGKIDFSTFKKRTDEKGTRGAGSYYGSDPSQKIGWFKLENDGDSAIVRFLVDYPDDFNIFAIHKMKVDGKWRSCNCKRGPYDPVGYCPFCAAKVKLSYKVFVPMLVYTPNVNGTMDVRSVIFDRPATKFINNLSDLMESCAPRKLSDVVCKITRHGASGDTNTEYIPMIAPVTYTDELCPKNTSAFDNFNVEKFCLTDIEDEAVESVLSENVADYVPKATYLATPKAQTAIGDDEVPFDRAASPAYGAGEAVRPRRAY